MSYSLNRKISGLTPYEPLSGTYRVRLDANESFYTLPETLLEKIEKAVKEIPFNRYPDPYAVELCRAFANFYGLSPEFLTAGNGSDELINIIVTAFSLKGEPCYSFAEDFSMYRFYGELAECERVILPKRNDLTIDVDEVIRRVNQADTGMLLFSNPCNPTSLGLKREEVRRLIRSVNCLVVLDEAYMDFWDQSLIDEVEEYDNLILLKTCSKAFGMAGIRLGFAVANPLITNALRAVKSPYNVNSVTQAIGTVVLREQGLLKSRTSELIESRKELEKELLVLAGRYPVLQTVYPSVTNFVFIKTEKSGEIAASLEQRSVAIRCFDGYLRITAGNWEENRVLIHELGEVLKEVSR